MSNARATEATRKLTKHGGLLEITGQTLRVSLSG